MEKSNNQEQQLKGSFNSKFFEVFEIFSRLVVWDFRSRKEPDYSFVIIMTKYWHEHGTELETMFLHRLVTLWINRFYTYVIESYKPRKFNDDTGDSQEISLNDHQQKCKEYWAKIHSEHPIFLIMLNSDAWKLNPLDKFDPKEQ